MVLDDLYSQSHAADPVLEARTVLLLCVAMACPARR